MTLRCPKCQGLAVNRVLCSFPVLRSCISAALLIFRAQLIFCAPLIFMVSSFYVLRSFSTQWYSPPLNHSNQPGHDRQRCRAGQNQKVVTVRTLFWNIVNWHDFLSILTGPAVCIWCNSLVFRLQAHIQFIHLCFPLLYFFNKS